MNTTPRDEIADEADLEDQNTPILANTPACDSNIDQSKIIKKLRNYALYLLTRRDHSEFELTQKIIEKGYATEDIEKVIPRLIETGLLDDQRFAENYISYRSRRGFGPNRLRMELKNKGVAETIIAQLLEITDNAWFSEALSVWRKRFKGQHPANSSERAKQTRFLYNRGFTQDQITQVFKHNDEDND